MSQMKVTVSVALLAMLLAAGPALATHPLGTEDPGTVSPMTLQLEVAGEGAKENVFSASLAAAWGAAETLDLVGEVLFESPVADGEDAPVAATAGRSGRSPTASRSTPACVRA